MLAYHLLTAIEHSLRRSGDTRSWETIREILRTHQVVTVVLPLVNGQEYSIRRDTVPEEVHRDIYRKLKIGEKIMKPVKTLHGTKRQNSQTKT